MYRHVFSRWVEVAALILIPLTLLFSAYIIVALFENAADVSVYRSHIGIGEPSRTFAKQDAPTPSPRDLVASLLGTNTPDEESTTSRDVAEEPPEDRSVSMPVVPTSSRDGTESSIEAEALSATERSGLLKLHNDARGKEGVPPLSWSVSLERSATLWAKELAEDQCALRHSYSGFGENIYYSRKYGSDQSARTPEEVMGEFLREGDYYDHEAHTCEAGRICGHYTQIMWTGTTDIGCAKSACVTDEREEVWVCHYTPAGNVVGEVPF